MAAIRFENRKRLNLEALITSKVLICVLMNFLLVACSTSVTTPVISASPVTQTSSPAVVKTDPGFTPIVTAVATKPSLPIAIKADQLLESAVAKLENATSFQMAAHEIRAYQIIDARDETKLVYGEFDTNYAVIRTPMLKVHAYNNYRYDPQADFTRYETYFYEENGRYFTRLVEASIGSDVQEIELQQVEPFAGDVYQTLVVYSNQADFLEENNGMAVYTLEHPEWYRLERAIGFADLGFLHGQDNGEQLVRQYVLEHYPNVKTLRFTIYVGVMEEAVVRVVIEEDEFMASIWAEVDRALIERGEDPNSLARYEVMSENGAEYLLSDYDHVEDFDIP